MTNKIDHREPLQKKCMISLKLEAAKKALFYIKYRCKEDDSAYKRVADVLNKAIKTLEEIE